MTAQRANSLCGADWLRNSFSIWRDLPRDYKKSVHPATFPVALASKLIDCYVPDRSGVLLDPFAGSGSALLAGLDAGMKTVGIDLNPEYRRVFLNRLTLLNDDCSRYAYHVKDARELLSVVAKETVDICITSPPYWDILNQRRSADGQDGRPYSGLEGDLGNMQDYEFFLDALGSVTCAVASALRPSRYFILNVMDIRKGPHFYAFHQDATTLVRDAGLLLEDIIVWDRQADYNSMRPLGYPYKFIINKVHEYLLVFRKASK